MVPESNNSLSQHTSPQNIRDANGPPSNPVSISSSHSNNTLLAKESNENSQTKSKKRVRTGCFNCRRRHKKCDEEKPSCKACNLRGDTCEWPSSGRSWLGRSNNYKRTADDEHDETFKRIKPSKPVESEKTSIPPVKSFTSLRALNRYSKNLENMEHSFTDANGVRQPESWNHGSSSSVSSPSVTSDKQNQPYSPNGLPFVAQVLNHSSQDGYNSSHVSNNGPNPSEHTPNSVASHTASSTANNQPEYPFAISPMSNSPNFLNFTDLQSTFREYMFANASTFNAANFEPFNVDLFNTHSALMTPNPLFYNEASGSVPKTINKRIEIDADNKELPILSQLEEKTLFKNYLYKVAPWLDMFDHTRQFGLQSTQLSKHNKSLRYSIYALSSRQYEKVDKTYFPSKTIALYQTALQQLIPTVNKTPDISTITACVLLCVFEMMSSSYEKWRYHLEGCSTLFKAARIHGFSPAYERALFWCFARMDVNSAVIGEQATMIEDTKWLPEDVSIYRAGEYFKKEKSYDMYANYMVFLCARVLNLISTDKGDFLREWELLYDEVIQWNLDKPAEMQPIMEFDAVPFPEILYDNGPAISANQLYHMSMILLIKNKPRLHKLKPSSVNKPATWHAKRICSISIHNDHHGCWNNSVQTLWIAGQLLTHKDEHKIVLDLLDKIEVSTGWDMKFRAKDLKEYWGE